MDPPKRGRPQKKTVVDDLPGVVKKRRGRRAKAQYYSSSIRKKISFESTIDTVENNIIHFADHADCNYSPAWKDSIVMCNSVDDGGNIYPSDPVATDPDPISCWWCAFPFDGFRLGLPIGYVDSKFKVVGTFCSFNCILAFGCNRSLVCSMYKRLTGNTGRLDVKKAPHYSLLKKFGGTMEIDQFRSPTPIVIPKRIEYPIVYDTTFSVEKLCR